MKRNEEAVICSRCGEEWARDPALEVPCPTCSAPIGLNCKRPSGHGVWGDQPHAARDEAAMKAGLLRRCSAAGLQPKAEAEKEEPASQMNLDFTSIEHAKGVRR